MKQPNGDELRGCQCGDPEGRSLVVRKANCGNFTCKLLLDVLRWIPWLVSFLSTAEVKGYL